LKGVSETGLVNQKQRFRSSLLMRQAAPDLVDPESDPDPDPDLDETLKP
jgi:hypothetical protein